MNWRCVDYLNCTRQRNDLHLPQANLTVYQRGAQYPRIKIFNNLPLEIKIVADNQKKFKRELKKCLCNHTFYTLEEYLTHSWMMSFMTSFVIIMVLWIEITVYGRSVSTCGLILSFC